MFHALFAKWFELSLAWGYPGVFLFMAIESTVFPLPSEIVIPPAAYWATQGRFSMTGVVLAATLGSWFGSAVSYWVARWVGRPVILRYGRYVRLTEEKWLLAERWVDRYGDAGIFFARLLPVVRHLISLPAGAARMPFGRFSLATLVGSGVWCSVLAWFGAKVLENEPELLQDPAALTRVLHEKLIWFVAGAGTLLALYVLVQVIGRQLRARAPTT
jgi:membrane protein DedA with SNARE-associated domain